MKNKNSKLTFSIASLLLIMGISTVLLPHSILTVLAGNVDNEIVTSIECEYGHSCEHEEHVFNDILAG